MVKWNSMEYDGIIWMEYITDITSNSGYHPAREKYEAGECLPFQPQLSTLQAQRQFRGFALSKALVHLVASHLSGQQPVSETWSDDI